MSLGVATMGTASEVRVPREIRSVGDDLHRFIAALYPICRSITGDGVRETLARIGELIPLEVHEVPSGTRVLDWTVPKEWKVRGAYIRDPSGATVVDFRDSNLHVVNYSVPVNAHLPLSQLAKHIHTLPDRPDWTPYRTSYYDESWGFCMSHRRYEALQDGEYEVRIDSSLENGSLTYGECLLPGASSDEVLISCHVCHPSLCNDNLSGIAVATFLAAALSGRSLRYSYRFLFVPGTIGSITWLARNEACLGRIRHGLVLAGLGDGGHLNYKKSRRGNAEIDRAVEHVLNRRAAEFGIADFVPYGYDERQYCSPGFDLPVGCLMRTPWGQYPEYHTSADDLDFVRPESLAETLETCLALVDVLEGNRRHLNLNPKGEPQLGRRGLYDRIGGRVDPEDGIMAVLWVLNLSDGQHDLLDIAERAGLDFGIVRRAADLLLEHELLRALPEQDLGKPQE
jgi:aminopeptidase-like protein